MPRGRPAHSEIRQRLVEILSHRGRDYGYNIYKLYCKIFPPVSMRVVYYHLNKGVELGVFRAERVKSEGERFSWGDSAIKVYYTLGASAMPLGMQEVQGFFSQKSA